MSDANAQIEARIRAPRRVTWRVLGWRRGARSIAGGAGGGGGCAGLRTGTAAARGRDAATSASGSGGCARE